MFCLSAWINSLILQWFWLRIAHFHSVEWNGEEFVECNHKWILLFPIKPFSRDREEMKKARVLF